MIFITVGSRGYSFHRLFQKMDALCEQGLVHDEIFAQIGTSEYTPVHFHSIPYISPEEFEQKMEQADLVISHGASGSIMKALQKGKKVIAVARLEKYGEHMNDHQLQINHTFAKQGYVLEADAELTNLAECIRLISEGKDYLKPWVNERPGAVRELIDDFIIDHWMENKVKILIILTGGIRTEGISLTQRDILSAMNLDGLQIDLLADSRADKKLLDEFRRIGCGTIPVRARKEQPFLYFLQLIHWIRKEKYDIIHVHGSSTLMGMELLASFLGGTRVRIAHSRNTRCNHLRIHKVLNPMFQLLTTDRMACGQEAGKWLFGEREFTVFHNGKDLERFAFSMEQRNQVRKQRDWTEKFVIGHVGSLNDQKNHSFLLEAFAAVHKKNPNAILVLAGAGSKERVSRLNEEKNRLGISDSVCYLGYLSDVAGLLSAMDLMVLPSRYEGLPNVVLEWQANGLPCLISDKVTRECAVSERCRFLPIDQGAELWAEQILSVSVVEDRSACSLMQREALRQYGFELSASAERMRQYYLNLAGKSDTE